MAAPKPFGSSGCTLATSRQWPKTGSQSLCHLGSGAIKWAKWIAIAIGSSTGPGSVRPAKQCNAFRLFGCLDTRDQLSFCVLHRPNLETGGGTIKPSGANRRNPNASENPYLYLLAGSPTIVVRHQI